MPTTSIPEGVTVELIEDGDWIDYSGKRSWGDKKRIRVNRLWTIRMNGNIIGHIRYVMATRENRTPGRMYVNSRWQSPAFQCYSTDKEFTSIYGGSGRWFERSSKSDCIESLVRNA